MEFFSLDPTAELMELEKECLSNGKALDDLRDIIILVGSDARPRRHVRNVIATSIFAMHRINKAASGDTFFEVKSFELALQMKDAITPTNSYFRKADRRLIIADLWNFYDVIKNVVDNLVHDEMTEKLRGLITPQHVVFDGSLSPDTISNLRRAGAKNISILPDTAGLLTIEVRGSTSETEFADIFSKLTVSNTPKVVYHQELVEKLREESDYIQMGDYTGPDFPFSYDMRSEEDKAMWGEVANGTVGALLLIQKPPYTENSRQTVGKKRDDEISNCNSKDIFLWGGEEEEDQEEEAESKKDR